MSNVKPRSKQPPGCNLGAPYQPSLINPYITNQPGFLKGRSQRPKMSATDLRKCTSNDVLSIRKLVVLSESLGPWGSSLPFRSHSWSPFNQSGGFVKGGPRMPKILRHSLSLSLSIASPSAKTPTVFTFVCSDFIGKQQMVQQIWVPQIWETTLLSEKDSTTAQLQMKPFKVWNRTTQE